MKYFSGLIIFLIIIIYHSQVLSQSCLPNGITFSTQVEINNFETNYPRCTEIDGTVTIYGDNISNLIGLNNIAKIGGNLDIHANNALTSLEGLDNLSEIAGGLRILDNYLLVNLDGLNNLYTIGKYFVVSENYSLANIEALNNITQLDGLLSISYNNALASLKGLNNITKIGGGLEIQVNDSLKSLEGLDNLTRVINYIDIYGNNALTSIEAIANINPEIIFSLSIYENASLTSCAAKSVCNYIANLSGHLQIKENSSGCNNVQEVEGACLNWISHKLQCPNFMIFPNPAKTKISIAINNGSIVSECAIFDCLGQKVLAQVNSQNEIDISKLNTGIYIVELSTNGLKFREILVINE